MFIKATITWLVTLHKHSCLFNVDAVCPQTLYYDKSSSRLELAKLIIDHRGFEKCLNARGWAWGMKHKVTHSNKQASQDRQMLVYCRQLIQVGKSNKDVILRTPY